MLKYTDQAKYPLSAKPAKLTLVDKADEAVDIRDILKQMNIWTPSGTFHSYKISCPWDYEHSDGGMDKNCRIYGGTHFYCWAMHGYITPTKLYARWKAVPREKAAEILLDERDLLRKPWRETWNDLIEQRGQPLALGSKNDVVAALHTALNACPEYAQNEFHPWVREKWTKVLGALDILWELPNADYAMLKEFFDKSLTALQTIATLAERSDEDD